MQVVDMPSLDALDVEGSRGLVNHGGAVEDLLVGECLAGGSRVESSPCFWASGAPLATPLEVAARLGYPLFH